MIKKIYRFFGGPKLKFQINEYLKSNFIVYQNYLLRKTEFYKFFNDFKNRHAGYEKIDLKLNHNKYSKEINPKEHFEIIEKLDIKLNPLYFKNLHTYGMRGIVFDKLYGKKIKQKYFLLPSNIVFLELISRINTKFIADSRVSPVLSRLDLNGAILSFKMNFMHG